jgi:CubicO group peptidase (beta-lactamase class C family)
MPTVSQAIRSTCLVMLTALPASAARADDALAQADALLKPLTTPDGPGGAVLVICDGHVVYQKAVGLANVEERVPNTTSTNFRIASLTKQFTALAVLMLVEEGKLTYETRLTEVFPDFPPYGKEITLRHLLSHTSGLLNYEDLMPRSTTRQLKDRDVLRLLREQKETAFPPGTKYRYSNSGYAVLALVVEKASGQKFADFLKRRIFTPLGMTNSVAYEEGGPPIANRAYGYTPAGAGFKRTDQSLTSAVLGDGGIYTSVEELFRWDQALYGPKLLRPDTLAQAFANNRLPDGRFTDYGFGWELGSHRGLRSFRHGGSTVGFRSELERLADKRLTAIVLCNRSDAKVRDIARGLVDLYLDGR